MSRGCFMKSRRCCGGIKRENFVCSRGFSKRGVDEGGRESIEYFPGNSSRGGVQGGKGCVSICWGF